MKLIFRTLHTDSNNINKKILLGILIISIFNILPAFCQRNGVLNNLLKKNNIISLNQNWLFGGEFKDEYYNQTFDDTQFDKINIPHCVQKLSWQNWDVKSWQKIWGYRKHFSLSLTNIESRVILHFDGVMVGATPCINGHILESHLGGYLPFEYDITPWVKKENILTVAVDSRWCNVPPQGSSEGPRRIDYLEPGGIHRSVYLRIVPKTYIKDVYCKTIDVLMPSRKINISCTINSDKTINNKLIVIGKLMDRGKVIKEVTKNIHITSKGDTIISLNMSKLNNIKLWDINNPKLYNVLITLYSHREPIQCYKTRIGFRSAEFRLNGFYLNGHRLQLFGLNRHELYPYVGYAMPYRIMREDAKILKNEYNCNIVRCSHYPQSEAFLEACDELGLLVWEEIPGWGYIGNKEWQDLAIRDVKDMIIRDRNHPSIIIWGTRINESKNDIKLYKKTREIAKELDNTRPTSGSMTSGTRQDWEKNWSQDVFAYDDYHADPDGSVGIEEPILNYPYMLSETVGQFNYSALKDFNCFYSRQINLKTLEAQAIRHAEAHSKAAATNRNCGVIGWCAFDYGSLVNAYKNVKTPGIADVFRIPKLGASFYQAQCNPKIKPTLIPNFYWSFSLKSPNGPGNGVSIFSNCEQLKLYIDDKLYSILTPNKSKMPYLKYPPFYTDLEFTQQIKPSVLRIEGYIKGKKVIEKTYCSDIKTDYLLLKADDGVINGDGSDATRVVFGIVDKFGSFRPYSDEKIEFSIEGPGEIIGDNPFDLSQNGGCGALWIRSKQNLSGDVTLKAKSAHYGVKTINIHVINGKDLIIKKY